MFPVSGGGSSYWLMFALVFLLCCLNEGRKVDADSSRRDRPLARLLRRLYSIVRDWYQSRQSRRDNRDDSERR